MKAPRGAAAALVLGILLVLGAVAAACDGGNLEREPPNISGEMNLDPTCRFIADELVVKFKGDQPTEEALKIIAEHDAHRIRQDLNMGGSWLLRVPEDRRDQLREALERNPAVEYVELNWLAVLDPRSGVDPCDQLTPRPRDLNGR
jgi:hypothetical protein